MSEVFDKKNNQIRQNGLIMSIDEVVELLNSQSKLISAYMYEFAKMNKDNKKSKEENGELKKQVAFWKKWALEYLTNYNIYTDEFLNTLESIEGEKTVQRIREKQNEIIKILKKEKLL